MNEIIKDLEEYLKDNKEKYEKIVVKNGFIGDSITCELYYDEVKDLIQFINKLQEENQALKEKINGVYEERDYLYNKTTTESKYIIQQLKDEIQDLKADYGNLAQIERDLYKIRIDKAIQILKLCNSQCA